MYYKPWQTTKMWLNEHTFILVFLQSRFQVVSGNLHLMNFKRKNDSMHWYFKTVYF